MAPEEISVILNEYLGQMMHCIKRTGGILDKFIGDAVMAEWNAPVAQEDHAARACETALFMIEELRTLREKWKREQRPLLSVRIGINSGEMVVGNMGSKEIFDYTVIGNEVNTLRGWNPLIRILAPILLFLKAHAARRKSIILENLFSAFWPRWR